ncbi:MAG TPA: acyltransferase [bacterium]|jgi:acetyltransferase-like isoleucine patch superfamily enzyme
MIHKKALVENESIGEGTRIWAFAHILKGAVIGSNCNVCDHTFIESDVIIGNNATIKSGVYLWNGVRIEDNVFVGPCVAFTNDLRPRSKAYPEKFVPTLIKQGASIGANCTVLCGITIGKYALIGAGAVITRDIPDYALAYGNPAKVHGYVCMCSKKITFEKPMAKCVCGMVYIKKNGIVQGVS